MPKLQMPKTAQKRLRRKKTEPMRFGLSTLRRFFLSSRWLSLGLLAVTVYALVDIYNEQRFYLTYIPVEGSIAVSPEEVADASGLAGHHVFAADPSAAAKKISALPGIISSTVTLQWPNQVFIEVSEEAPIAIWSENGVEYGITQNGQLIPVVRANPGLLRIESEVVSKSLPSNRSGTPAELSDSGVRAGADNITGVAKNDSSAIPKKPATSLAFIPGDVLDGAIQLRELRPTIEKLYYQPDGGLSYQDGRGWRGYFGTGHHMNQKLAVYETVVTDLLARSIQPAYISVSNQEKPFYKLGGVPGTEVEQSP